MRSFSSVVGVFIFGVLTSVFVNPVGAQPAPVGDVLALSGQVRVGPSPDGVVLSDELSYSMTLFNESGSPLRAGEAIISASVNRFGARGRSEVVITGLDGSGFGVNGGGTCAVGVSTRNIRCANTNTIPPGGREQLTITYRHAEAEEDNMLFFAQAEFGGGLDPDSSNNAFVGPTYSFAPDTPPTTEPTTTTTDPTATTVEETTTTEAPTTTETTEETSTTVEETTTTETTADETTTTVEETATTEAPATTPDANQATTALAQSTAVTVIERPQQADDLAEGESGVLGITGSADDEPPLTGSALPPLGPEGEEDQTGIWPLVIIGLVGLLLAGGAAVLYLRFWSEDPPLVDIRQYR